MSPDQAHRCEVRQGRDGVVFLAFFPASGAVSSYSNSLFTLDLRPGVARDEAEALATHINRLLAGVSTTVF
ncbi:hypothetical protein LRS10_00985 [Phenylobacterium sp. J426]|uniref:hypothetical protein n=1 Tax=Phenylobacterium sp. J426 TaxID=2898439 RepID=UPI00215164A1|nr:hypothetical protein [Phenylobacterium sp. J426]MCR5872893.1 hypothetical protein [Phenylobacterium sp. J426]